MYLIKMAKNYILVTQISKLKMTQNRGNLGTLRGIIKYQIYRKIK